MTEHPILFSGPMVRAILAGAKTQTRRVCKPEWLRCLDSEDDEDRAKAVAGCPYGAPGMRLWVRETWAEAGNEDHAPLDPRRALYRADTKPGDYGADVFQDGREYFDGWRPSIHMPRWASRIDLEVTGVRVERLQEISEEDARAEGVDEWIPCEIRTGIRARIWGGGKRQGTAREHFSILWDSINSKRGYGWDANPWVWVIEFRRVRP